MAVPLQTPSSAGGYWPFSPAYLPSDQRGRLIGLDRIHDPLEVGFLLRPFPGIPQREGSSQNCDEPLREQDDYLSGDTGMSLLDRFVCRRRFGKLSNRRNIEKNAQNEQTNDVQ